MNKYSRYISLTVLYFFMAYAGLALTSINNSSSPIWPATGLAFALLYYYGSKYWLSVGIGAFLANLTTGAPIYTAAIIGIGNAGEAFIGVLILVIVRNWRRREHENDGEILGSLTASFLASTVSATIGTLALYLGGVIDADGVQLTWITWWSGDVVGGIVAFPVALFALNNVIKPSWIGTAKLISVGLVSLVISIFVFGYKAGEPFAFLIFLGLLLALYSSGQLGLYFAFLVVAVTGVLFTLYGYGPFVMGHVNYSLMALQIFLGSLGLTCYVLGEFQKSIPLKYLARPLIIGWLISGAIFHSYYQQHVARDQMRLKALAREYTGRIENQFQLHRRALRASSGLFTASNDVTHNEFKIFTDTLDIKMRFRAMLGIGYIQPVLKSELPAHIASMKKKIPNFEVKKVKELTDGSEYINSDWSYIIEYLEPAELSSTIGLDVATEKFRYEAANLARDSGQTVLSRNVSLRINRNKGVGFLLFVPVYKVSKKLDTVEERRQHFKGWLYAPLLMQDLMRASMNNILDENAKNELDYEVYLKNGDRKLLLTTTDGFFSNNPRYELLQTTTLVSKQEFIINWRPNANFISSRDFTLAWVGAMGVLLTLASAWLLMSSQTFMARADQIVQEQTNVISGQNQLWLALMESSPVGVLHVDEAGN